MGSPGWPATAKSTTPIDLLLHSQIKVLDFRSSPRKAICSLLQIQVQVPRCSWFVPKSKPFVVCYSNRPSLIAVRTHNHTMDTQTFFDLTYLSLSSISQTKGTSDLILCLIYLPVCLGITSTGLLEEKKSMHILLFGYNSARSRRRIHLDWESKTTQASERLIFGSIFRDCEYGYSGIKDGKI